MQKPQLDEADTIENYQRRYQEQMRVLKHLEEQLPLLSDADQDFVLGVRTAVDFEGKLTEADIKRIQSIAATLEQTDHNILGTEAPLSMSKVIKDLAGAIHMLSPQEKVYATGIAKKLAQKVPLTLEEIEGILAIHGAKGF